MKKLIKGQRAISLGVLLGLIAVVAVGVGVLLFISDLRTTAKTAQEAEQQLRSTILARCQQRVIYDQRFITKVKSDVAKDLAAAQTWQRLYDSTKDLPIAPGTSAAVLKAYRENQATILAAADSARESAANGQKIVNEGAIGNCAVYDDPAAK